MTEPVWLLPTDVLGLHEMQIMEIGGADGIRDGGGIDRVLRDHNNTFISVMFPMYINWPLFTLRRLRQRSTFVDGNKRTGFACALLFLELNGWNLWPIHLRQPRIPWLWRIND